MDKDDLDRREKKANIDSLLVELNKQLISYKIVDSRNQIIAIVKDIRTDNHQDINLLIHPVERLGLISFYQLNSRHINNIDTENKQIIINIPSEEIHQLPSYQPLPSYLQKEVEGTKNSGEHSVQNSSLEIKNQEELLIPLLEERLLVNRHKRKLGEIVVRKKIETEMIQVPIRREKLIVEQIGEENRQLAEIDLGNEEIAGVELTRQNQAVKQSLIKTEFLSLKSAREILFAIACQSESELVKVKLEIVTDSPQQQAAYQEILDLHLGTQLTE